MVGNANASGEDVNSKEKRGVHGRAGDLDDFQSVLAAVKDVDWAYLAGQMQRFKIIIPRGAEPFLPERVLQFSRDVKRAHGRRL